MSAGIAKVVRAARGNGASCALLGWEDTRVLVSPDRATFSGSEVVDVQRPRLIERDCTAGDFLEMLILEASDKLDERSGRCSVLITNWGFDS